MFFVTVVVVYFASVGVSAIVGGRAPVKPIAADFAWPVRAVKAVVASFKG